MGIDEGFSDLVPFYGSIQDTLLFLSLLLERIIIIGVMRSVRVGGTNSLILSPPPNEQHLLLNTEPLTSEDAIREEYHHHYSPNDGCPAADEEHRAPYGEGV